MGFLEVLTIIFVVMKLVGLIDWSWWLVLLPSIISVVIYCAALFFIWLKTEKEFRKY